MCGIAGFIDPAGLSPEPARDVAARMAGRLAARGPDDAGVWVDAAAGVALAHRRLSVVDLSAAGRQPMTSACGRYVIVFNGEIYNHRALRGRLGGHDWRGHSDTETLLAAIAAWGVEATLHRCVGMFAFALWDCKTRGLTLARDRMGEKPLYYGWQGRVLLFASELKSLREHPAFVGEVDRATVALMLFHNHIPAPYSIYRGIGKLAPGALWHARFDSGGQTAGEVREYWSLREAAARGQEQPFCGGREEAAARLEELLEQSLAGQMAADVPLGAFLSGGVDSSTIVALMQARHGKPVKTFCIGFHEAGYDEAKHARAVARHLGTEHTQLYITPADARAVIPRLPEVYDEPFADSAQIPAVLLAALAREQVTVALTGDGGDELFGGYTRYLVGARLARRLRRWPMMARRGLAAAVTMVPDRLWDYAGGAFGRGGLSARVGKLARLARARDFEEAYRQLTGYWQRPGAVVIGAAEPEPRPDAYPSCAAEEHRMMLADALGYLPDDVLVKLDRAAMAHGLETRAPFLDHRIVEFAWALPLRLKIRHGRGKWVLRELLRCYLPPALIARPKRGFDVPIGAWLRGPLREWAEDLLDESRLRREGFFHPAPIRRQWLEHIGGRRDRQHNLWNVLMFQAWLAREGRQ